MRRKRVSTVIGPVQAARTQAPTGSKHERMCACPAGGGDCGCTVMVVVPVKLVHSPSLSERALSVAVCLVKAQNTLPDGSDWVYTGSPPAPTQVVHARDVKW